MQGAPGWSIAWSSEDERVFGRAKVSTTISLLVTEQHKIDQKFIPLDYLTDQFLQIDIGGALKAPLILESDSPGSNKKFRITVDDSGAITATEV